MLSRSNDREGAAALLGALEADPQVQIIPLTNRLYHEAFGLFLPGPTKSGA